MRPWWNCFQDQSNVSNFSQVGSIAVKFSICQFWIPDPLSIFGLFMFPEPQWCMGEREAVIALVWQDEWGPSVHKESGAAPVSQRAPRWQIFTIRNSSKIGVTKSLYVWGHHNTRNHIEGFGKLWKCWGPRPSGVVDREDMGNYILSSLARVNPPYFLVVTLEIQ